MECKSNEKLLNSIPHSEWRSTSPKTLCTKRPRRDRVAPTICRFYGTRTFSVLSGHRSATFNMVAHMFARTMNMCVKMDAHCRRVGMRHASRNLSMNKTSVVSPPNCIGDPKQQMKNFAHRQSHSQVRRPRLAGDQPDAQCGPHTQTHTHTRIRCFVQFLR